MNTGQTWQLSMHAHLMLSYVRQLMHGCPGSELKLRGHHESEMPGKHTSITLAYDIGTPTDEHPHTRVHAWAHLVASTGVRLAGGHVHPLWALLFACGLNVGAMCWLLSTSARLQQHVHHMCAHACLWAVRVHSDLPQPPAVCRQPKRRHGMCCLRSMCVSVKMCTPVITVC